MSDEDDDAVVQPQAKKRVRRPSTPSNKRDEGSAEAVAQQLKRSSDFDETAMKLYPSPKKTPVSRTSSTAAEGAADEEVEPKGNNGEKRVKRKTKLIDSAWATQVTLATDHAKLANEMYDMAKIGADTSVFAKLGVYKDIMYIPPPDKSPKTIAQKKAMAAKNRKSVLGTNDLREMRDHTANPHAHDTAKYFQPFTTVDDDAIEKWIEMYNKCVGQHGIDTSDEDIIRNTPKKRMSELLDAMVEANPDDPHDKCSRGARCEFSVMCNLLRHPGNRRGEKVGKGFRFFPHGEDDEAASDLKIETRMPVRWPCILCLLVVVNKWITDAIRDFKHVKVNPFQVYVGPGEFHESSCRKLSPKIVATEGLFPTYDRKSVYVPKNAKQHAAENRPARLSIDWKANF